MLERQVHTDIRNVPIDEWPHGSHRLQMFQAYEGDLLRICSDSESVIVDSGPAACAETVRDLLQSRKRCRLLILTHLDRDHYGGLRVLVEEALKARNAAALAWPDRVWVNEFEPRGSVNALMDGLEHDGDPADLLVAAIGAANEWRAHNPVLFTDVGDEKRDREWLFGNARLHVTVGEDAFAYLTQLLRIADHQRAAETAVAADVEAVLKDALHAVELALDLHHAGDGEEIRLRALREDLLRRCARLIERAEHP
jgi:hypothetical protein